MHESERQRKVELSHEGLALALTSCLVPDTNLSWTSDGEGRIRQTGNVSGGAFRFG